MPSPPTATERLIKPPTCCLLTRWEHYKFLWWIPGRHAGRYMAAGNLGQFMYVAPDKELLILRFGVLGGVKGWRSVFPQIFKDLADSI